MPEAASSANTAYAELITSLDSTFREQVRRAVGMGLDGSVESLAVVDHYLRMGLEEERTPILLLMAAGAGAYFGELVRTVVGATWIGDGKDPRRLRLLLEPQFVYFSPVDMALQAVLGGDLSADDQARTDLRDLDATFHLRTGPGPEQDESAWIEDRLSEVAPVPEDQFHTLTCRFETLTLMLELLAARQAAEGRTPRTLGVADYVAALSPGGGPDGPAGPGQRR